MPKLKAATNKGLRRLATMPVFKFGCKDKDGGLKSRWKQGVF